MKYGYARVSTKGQQREGNSLEAQEKALREAGAETIYTEAFTGMKKERPKFQELLVKLQPGDTLIVTKLDRFARSISQGTALITELIDKGVIVYVLNMGILSNDSMSTFMRNVLLSFAQFERDMIVERTSEGKAIARENNPDYREGRKKEVCRETFQEVKESVDSKKITVVDACNQLGISRTQWYRMCKESA